MTEFKPHSAKQASAVYSDAPIVVTGTGIQWGKTTVGAIRMNIALHTYTDPSDNFLIVAPTYKILQQSTLPAFLKECGHIGTLSKADMVFSVHGGGTVYFRTATDPDSIVGITNIRAVWGDEAGLFTLYFWENVQARAAFKEAPITLTTSPYTLNWLYKEIIRPKQRDPSARPECDLTQAASWENPFMPRSVIDRAREVMDPRRFNALFGGQWERMAGLVYDCADEDENQCDSFPLPHGTKVVGGIDWGWTEPFVLKVRAITPDDRQWGIHEFYRSQLTITDICAAVARLVTTWNIQVIYAGPDQPASIEELNRYFRKQGLKCSVVPANNDVRLGIDRHYELLRTRRLKYVRGENPHTWDELDTYHYPEPHDLKPDQNSKDHMPVQQNDHALDADRYISIMTYAGAKRFVPRVPAEVARREDVHTEFERLKKPVRVGGRTENW